MAQPFTLSMRQAMGAVAAFFGVVVSGGANLAMSLKGSRGPLAPDPARGLVVPYPDHNTIHYVTRAFDTWATVAIGAQFLFMALLALAIGSVIFKNRLP